MGDGYRPPDVRKGRSDIRSISMYGLERIENIIGAYEAFLDDVRGEDDVSFHLVLQLLGAETHRKSDIEAALAGSAGSPIAVQPAG